MRQIPMRLLSIILAWLLAAPAGPLAIAQTASRLNLVIVEGEGAINNIRQRTSREAIVQVEDENHRPVAGVAVVFATPGQGASATFADGSHTLTAVTDNQGRAVARGMRPNNLEGQYKIHVTASRNGETASTDISQSNAVAAAAAAAGGISGKLIAILAVAGAAVAGGVVAATRGGNNGNGTSPTSGTTISAGTGSVGPPR
jgi:hypothetical protein